MVPLLATLFLFWLILSGKFDLFHLSLGVLSVLVVARSVRSLRGSQKGGNGDWKVWPGYLIWLSWQVVVSTYQVTRIILSPRMPIDPRVMRFKKTLPNSFAVMTLANSITLTPGTVTLDVEGDEYEVHALTSESADTLATAEGLGEMPERVGALFRS